MTPSELLPKIRLPDGGINFSQAVVDFEEALIRLALNASKNNVKEAARLLHMKHSTTLAAKIIKYGIKAQRPHV